MVIIYKRAEIWKRKIFEVIIVNNKNCDFLNVTVFAYLIYIYVFISFFRKCVQ